MNLVASSGEVMDCNPPSARAPVPSVNTREKINLRCKGGSHELMCDTRVCHSKYRLTRLNRNRSVSFILISVHMSHRRS